MKRCGLHLLLLNKKGFTQKACLASLLTRVKTPAPIYWRTTLRVYSPCTDILVLHVLRVKVFDYKSLGLPSSVHEDILASTDCVFLYLPKVAELEQELAECEDGLDHYQNIVTLK